MLPFLKMLDMIPDTNGIQNAIAKQFGRAEGSMEKGNGQPAAFFEILNNMTASDADQLKGLARDFFDQDAGQIIDGPNLAGHAPHGGLSRFQLVRQLFAKFTAHDQKGLTSENNAPTDKDKRHHWDGAAWWETVLPMLDPQAVEAGTDPLVADTSLLEGSVGLGDAVFENGEQPVDEFIATRSSQNRDPHTTQTREAKAGLATASDKTDEAKFRSFSDLIDDAKPVKDQGNGLATNLSAAQHLKGKGLKHDEAITQQKNGDAATDVSAARLSRPFPPGLADSDVNQVRQLHVIAEKSIEKGVDPKVKPTMAPHTQQDSLAFKPGSNEQNHQLDKDGSQPIQADPRFKTISKETKKMSASTASIKSSENTSQPSTDRQAPPIQEPKDRQEQLVFARNATQTNTAALSEKDGVSVMVAKPDDATIETVSQKPTIDPSDRTISRPSESEPAAPTKEERVDVIRQIVQRMTLRQWGTQSQMIIRLKPDMLGQLRMQVISENHQLAVRMTAESSVVKDLIEQNLHHLKSELNLHGLEIQKIDVTVQNENQDSRHGQDTTEFEQFARRNEEERKRKQHRQAAFEHKEDLPAQIKPADNRHLSSNSGEVDYFV